MKKTLQHIAIPVIIFYVFPLFFQPLHVVFHHTSCSHSESAINHHEKTAHHQSILHQNKDCSLCDYESLISNIQKIKNQLQSPAQTVIFFSWKRVMAPDLANVNFNPLRAPPVL